MQRGDGLVYLVSGEVEYIDPALVVGLLLDAGDVDLLARLLANVLDVQTDARAAAFGRHRELLEQLVAEVPECVPPYARTASDRSRLSLGAVGRLLGGAEE